MSRIVLADKPKDAEQFKAEVLESLDKLRAKIASGECFVVAAGCDRKMEDAPAPAFFRERVPSNRWTLELELEDVEK